jgi:hypothetical protein
VEVVRSLLVRFDAHQCLSTHLTKDIIMQLGRGTPLNEVQ